MKKGITILLLISTSLVYGSPELFDSANTSYKEGSYADAIQIYETILEKGESAELLYNLGNTYYKTGEFTLAILHYEKALKYAPNDKDIRHNLNIANLNVVDKIEATPEFFLLTWWKSLATKLKADQWTIFFLIALWLSVLSFLTFAFMNASFRKLFFVGGLGGIVLSVVLLLLALTQHHYESGGNSAILLSASASVKSAPLNSGKDLFIIHEGLKVTVIDKEGDWFKICLPDDKQGWLPKEMVAVI